MYKLLCIGLLLLPGCRQKVERQQAKEINVKYWIENHLNPAKIKEPELRAMAIKNYQIASDEYGALVKSYGAEKAKIKSFDKSFVKLITVDEKDITVLDYQVSRCQLKQDTLFLLFDFYNLGGTNLEVTCTRKKYLAGIGYQTQCMMDRPPSFEVTFDSLILNKEKYELGDTVYGELQIRGLERFTKQQLFAKGKFRSIIE